MKVVVLYVLFTVQACASSSLPIPSVDMCGSKTEITLQAHGEASSTLVKLNPLEKSPVCKLHVIAPRTHVVSLQFVENDGIKQSANNSEEEDSPPCVMSIFLPDNNRTPFWKGDPCSKGVLSDIDLLTNDFKILWTPPDDPWHAKGRKFVLTAVGSGSVCKEPFQYTCMRIGRIPMLCVSNHLLCDGYKNCPKGSSTSDEDEKLCKNRVSQNAWKKLIVELYKNYRPPVQEDVLMLNASDYPDEWTEWQLLKKNVTSKKTTVVEENHNASETISVMLNKYGPWGYLMLGLLICGTVLFFCGLWECCCRKPKTDIDPPPITQPTTVLIMNCEEGETTPQPPNYDELDRPPSYLTLFPNFKEQSTSSESEVQSNENSSENINSAEPEQETDVNSTSTSENSERIQDESDM